MRHDVSKDSKRIARFLTFFLGHDIMTEELTQNMMLKYYILAIPTCQMQSL